MSYTALYRKFRPTGFEDVKGQEHIVTTLQNQVKADRLGHAYLFCGTRGTGKTTIAKILAKAANCEHPVEGSPCNECESCRKINQQISMNVVEIDAASNNGVDNIREIIDEVQYSPQEGRYKVYIIDEVHMLSTGAFNALLKTLEEPPSYVIFILATTEPHKIPITILSRCQRYDFKRISIDTIAERLTELMEKEHVSVEEKAIRYVAKAADGSMRDALSLLDQCLAFYYGKDLTYDNVLEVLGAVDVEVFSQCFRAVRDCQPVVLLELLDRMVNDGRELGQFVSDFVWYLRNMLLIKTSQQSLEMVDVASEDLPLLREEGDSVDSETIIRYIRILSDLSNKIRYASQKRVLVEVALIKMCTPQMETGDDSILDRIRVLEKKMEQGVPVAAGNPSVSYTPSGNKSSADEAPAVAEILPDAVPEDIQMAAKNWGSIVNRLGKEDMILKSLLELAIPSVGEGGSTLLLAFDYMQRTRARMLESEEKRQELEQIISDVIQKNISIKIVIGEPGLSAKETFPDIRNIVSKMEQAGVPVELE
ncbi:MAG: DNA polymerase III subunit gamma/tau [Clostridiales bacterium]|nr:DNA polymerase III subunit gamma/tau [Clostridiales bacterium]